jgi:hypothetical protein
VRAIAIVNGTAPRLGDRLRGRLARALPGGVIVTRSLDEARAAIHAEVARGVDLIALGGGDGTFVMGLALIGEACRGAGRPEPAIGVLRLGTANAIADVVGATADPADDLARLVRAEGAWRPMPMLRVLGFRAPFAGVGAGAQAVEGREAIARVVDRVPIARRFVGGAARGALSAALRSAQRLASPSRAHAVIANLGAPTIEAYRGGAPGRSIATGADLWSGACSLIAASTISPLAPAGRPPGLAGVRADRFRLRCGEAGWRDLLRGDLRAMRSDRRLPQAPEFLCDRVQIQLSEEALVEAGGELLGRRRTLEIELGDPVTVASLAG